MFDFIQKNQLKQTICIFYYTETIQSRLIKFQYLLKLIYFVLY